MLQFHFFYILASLLALAVATTPPTYKGYTRVWSDNFGGKAKTSPNQNHWEIVSRTNNFNQEYQVYSRSHDNVRLSGSGTLQLVPLRNKHAKNGWTSGRVESKYVFTPKAGKVTIVEASLRLGGNSAVHKMGLWPAFWLLGESSRHGTKWPATGEVDIMENVNGQKIVYGVAHCDKLPGGICNEPYGLPGTVSLSDSKFHVWRVKFNRGSSQWKKQTITWYKDGARFHQVTGAHIGSQSAWKTLCQSPMYIILNVAIGGDFPGPPNSRTYGGGGSVLEAKYVAHYVSK